MRRELKIIRGVRFWKSLLSREMEGRSHQRFQDRGWFLSGWDVVVLFL